MGDFTTIAKELRADTHSREVYEIKDSYVLSSSPGRAVAAYCEQNGISAVRLTKKAITEKLFEALHGVDIKKASGPDGAQAAGADAAGGNGGDGAGRQELAQAGVA